MKTLYLRFKANPDKVYTFYGVLNFNLFEDGGIVFTFKKDNDFEYRGFRDLISIEFN